MKILELAPYLFIEDHPHGSRNKSGLAYMVRSICDMVSKENEVHVLTQSIITKEQKVGDWILLRRNLFTVFKSIKFRYVAVALQMIRLEGLSKLPRVFLYALSAGQVERHITKWRPDIVHIHSITPYTLPYLYAATICKVPVVITLHALFSFNEIVPVPTTQRELERAFLRVCVKKGYSLSVISSGMKRKIQSATLSSCNNISVITNCFRPIIIPQFDKKETDEYRIICVGAIYPLKNQIQVIRCLPLIQERMKDRGKVFLDIYGEGEKRKEWEDYCVKNDIDGVTFHGRKEQIEIFKALARSDLLVFPSIEEGFGIPIIEAYNCGVPVVAFSDIDAAEDIGNTDCCILASNRLDETLTESIVEGLIRVWDKNKIKEYSKTFSSISISKEYNTLLKNSHKKWEMSSIKAILHSF